MGELETVLENLSTTFEASEGVEVALQEGREVFNLGIEGLDAREVTDEG